MFNLDAGSIISKYLRRKIGDGRAITEKELSPIFREIKTALLNADVSYSVVKEFLNEVKQELLGRKDFSDKESVEVIVFTTIKKHLTKILGEKNEDKTPAKGRLCKILVVGLNGVGKTTTVAKLANHFQNKHGSKTKVIGLDIYRPGAFDQLSQLVSSVNIPCYPTVDNDWKTTIKSHISSSEREGINCIIFDNFGLLPGNKKLLDEVAKIKKDINPTEIFFVVDSMSGQNILDAVKVFHEHLGVTGIVVSKTDSNAPMGGVFSISYILKIPIRYMGTGEKITDLSLFHPDRIANLILGEGDILSLAEKLEDRMDVGYTKRFFSKIMKGNFDLDDLICQIREIRKVGSLKGIMGMIPGFNKFSPNMNLDDLEKQLAVWEVIINSMTTKERKNPKVFKKQPERKARVVKGSGKKAEELNKLLKRYEDVKQNMNHLSSLFKKGGNPFNFFSKG